VWDEAKNLAAVARVAPHLPWPVLVAGEGDVDARVQALGRLERPELDRVLAESAIFAAPARYEPFGLTALEAARAGCALVLGDLPSQHELWEDAAVFVDPSDEAALERALRSLIADPERRALLAGRAHDRSLEYTAERMAGGYVAAYARAAGRRTVEAA
jgi:glycosyltransferase involved in cell wall biosynthesis